MTGKAIDAAAVAFKQALIEASLNAERTPHLGHAPSAETPEAAGCPSGPVTPRRLDAGSHRR
jgi:hypothetical protein